MLCFHVFICFKILLNFRKDGIISMVFAAAAAAAKSLQSCLTLRDPIDGLLPGSSVPGIL